MRLPRSASASSDTLIVKGWTAVPSGSTDVVCFSHPAPVRGRGTLPRTKGLLVSALASAREVRGLGRRTTPVVCGDVWIHANRPCCGDGASARITYDSVECIWSFAVLDPAHKFVQLVLGLRARSEPAVVHAWREEQSCEIRRVVAAAHQPLHAVVVI